MSDPVRTIKDRVIIFGVPVDVTREQFIDLFSDEAYGGDRNRPYNGQAHTSIGKRGQTLVIGLTKRDIADCIRRGQILADPLDGGARSDIAAIQNAMCEIEKMMGVFPDIDTSEPLVIPVYEILTGRGRR